MSKTGDTIRVLSASALVAVPAIVGTRDDCAEHSVSVCQQENPDLRHLHGGEPERAVVERGPTSEIALPAQLPPGRSTQDFTPALSKWLAEPMGNDSEPTLVLRMAALAQAAQGS